MKHCPIITKTCVATVIACVLFFPGCQQKNKVSVEKTPPPAATVDTTPAPAAAAQDTDTVKTRDTIAAETRSDTTITDSLFDALDALQQVPAFLSDSAIPKDSSGYGALCDSLKKLLGWVPVYGAGSDVINEKVRAAYARRERQQAGENGQADSGRQTDEIDSLNLALQEQKAYLSILGYKRLMSFGVALSHDSMPKFISDKPALDQFTLKTLPKIQKSANLADGSFFFIGAGPFLISRGMASAAPQRKPEILFACAWNSSTNQLLNVVRCYNFRINVTFGGPLSTYEGIPKDVNGIGSLIHTFIDRVPVYFLTEGGIVPARLVSVQENLSSEEIGCVSDASDAVFACSSLPKGEILGIYMPYDLKPPLSCIVKRTRKLWTADLNGDSVPEFAGISHPYASVVSSGSMLNHLTWYANIDGEWKMIGDAQEPDCT